MRLSCYFLFSLLLYAFATHATEYVYPVAFLEDESAILYIHQRSVQHIELFQWNQKNNTTEQVLWSIYNPTGLQLLPGNVGFSFIDNGRLRIKRFERRSAKTIDFDEPLFNFNGLHWIDEHTCYCSAQQGDKFSLFELQDNGMVQYLMNTRDKDCMYPQKIDSQLFYIERYIANMQYRIMQTYYSNDTHNKSATVVMDFGDTPIIFLRMLTEQLGFVIAYENTIESECLTARFSYHQVQKKGNVWEKTILFDFEIPTYLFLYHNDQRLFESILPLLPCHRDNAIYFVSCSDNENYYLEPYYYDVVSMEIKKIIMPNNHHGHCFVPIKCGNTLCVGGSKQPKEPSMCFLT